MALTTRSPRLRQAASSRRALEAQLRPRVNNWREMLQANVAKARPVFDALLAGRIVTTPHPDAPRSAPILDVRYPTDAEWNFRRNLRFPRWHVPSRVRVSR